MTAALGRRYGMCKGQRQGRGYGILKAASGGGGGQRYSVDGAVRKR